MPFEVEKKELDGVVLLKPRVFDDSRGFFLETYKKSEFEANGITANFVQDNYSRSKKGVIRAIHYQLPPFAQGKLVQVIKGRVWDVAVDLRKSSPTFKKWVGVELSEENHHLFYIPPGFGHGFVALSDEVHLLYKCTAEYDKASERGVRWDDPELALPWGIDTPIVSEKDVELPFLDSAELFD